VTHGTERPQSLIRLASAAVAGLASAGVTGLASAAVAGLDNATDHPESPDLLAPLDAVHTSPMDDVTNEKLIMKYKE